MPKSDETADLDWAIDNTAVSGWCLTSWQAQKNAFTLSMQGAWQAWKAPSEEAICAVQSRKSACADKTTYFIV
jgi:hypothetical protein